MVAGRASAKLVGFFLSLQFCFYLFSVKSHRSPIPQSTLELKLLYLLSMTYPKGWMYLSTLGILCAVDLSSITQWTHKRSLLSSLALPTPCAFLQPNTLLPCSVVFLRLYPSSAVPSFAPSLLSVTCYKVPDTSHTLHRSVVLSHAQKKMIKECIKIWILVKNKVWFNLQKK